jgi:ligand-binding sensor domain-containing protein/two-component sensor histidine kinase
MKAKSSKVVKLFFLLLGIVPLCYAQTNVIFPKVKSNTITYATGHAFFKNFSTKDGLPLNAFECSYIDRKGNLWLGTTGAGVCRYDGTEFICINAQHGLTNDVVTSIFEDRNGNFWFGTYDGINRYDGKKITTFFQNEGLEFNTVRSISEDKNGSLWFGTLNGVTRFDGGQFTNLDSTNWLAHRPINASIVDRKGNIWFGASGGLSRFDGKSFTNFTKEQGLETNEITSLFEDGAGNLWIGGYEGGVTQFDGRSAFRTFTQKDGLPNNNIWSIAQDHDGNLWLASSGGLTRYVNSHFITYTTSNGLPSKDLASISVDNDGNLWITYYNGGGVSLLSSLVTTSFSSLDLPALGKVRTIAENKKADILWIGTEDGLVKYDGESFKKFDRTDGLPSEMILTLTKSRDDALWVGTIDGGLCKFNGKTFKTINKKDGLIANDIWATYEDKNGNLWISYNESGLSQYDGKNVKNFFAKSGLPKREVNCITEDTNGTLWVGTNGGGLSFLEGEKFITYTDAQGLPSKKILSIVSDDQGSLWIGTDQGISRYDGKTFLNFSLGKKWGANVIHELVFTANGELVLGTNSGLFVLFNFISNTNSLHTLPASNQLLNKELNGYNPRFQEFSFTSGYQIGAISGVGANALMVDQSESIWAATHNSGLVRFDLNSVRSTNTQPKVDLERVTPSAENLSWYSLLPDVATDSITRSFQEKICYGRSLTSLERQALQKKMLGVRFDQISPFNSLPIGLTLPYAHNQLFFEFKVSGISANQGVSYQYILEGEDKEWSAWGNNTTATYNNLYEGRYTFKVRAMNPIANSVGKESISFSFFVTPPWYRTWWAYAGYVFAIFISIVLGVQLNIRRLKAKNLELEAAVQDRTEEIATQNEELIVQQEEIVAQRDTIENHNRVLELTVTERTVELARSHDELKKQFHKLRQFSFIVAHNLRSPVARIMGLANIFNRNDLTDPINLTVLDRTVEATMGLDETLSDLNRILYVQNDTHAEKVVVDFNELLAKIKNRFANEIEAAGIIIKVETNVITFTTILPFFESILTNLLENAIKYRAPTPTPQITIEFLELQSDYRLIVSDNGLGFDSEKQVDKLFEPFQRFNTTNSGKGIGLYLVKCHVEALEGTIYLTSKSGVGTKVEIMFPQTDAKNS